MFLYLVMNDGKIDTEGYLEKQPPGISYLKKPFLKV